MDNSASLTVTPVTDNRLMSIFITLPRHLYKGYKGYVPSLDIQQKNILHPKKSPFFKFGECRYFIAFKEGKPVGRISAQIDSVALKQWNEPIGCFGALDTIEDPAVVEALLRAAEAWLRQKGMKKIRGPFTLNFNSESGCMIMGQTAPPMIAMPWHPTWVGAFTEQAGYKKAMDLFSYQMEYGPQSSRSHIVPAGLTMGEGSLGQITTRMLDKKNIQRDGEILRSLYNNSWKNNWGFVPLTKMEIKSLIKELKPLLKPEHFVLVEQKGKPLAVALVVPNLYDITYDINGAPTLLQWAKLGIRILRHRFHSARVILLGVSSEIYGTALGAVMPALVISELMNRGKVLPYKTIELGWILENNTPMRRLIERLVPEPSKKYRLFEKDL
ncbi:hypothetical protein [Entomobacter blattae]|nr:hypothetical protein [Entomobacter blattae]